MFFFIGGVQPKTVKLEGASRLCDACGLYQLRPMRTDHYLSLFFIPIFPIKKGETYYRCRSCGAVMPESGEESFALPIEKTCPGCGRPVKTDFQFCPFCGKDLTG